MSLTGNYLKIREVSGFGQAAEPLFFRQKWPKLSMPRPASLNGMGANFRRAGQLAALTQGPPVHEGIHSLEAGRRRPSAAKEPGRQEGFGNYMVLKNGAEGGIV